MKGRRMTGQDQSDIVLGDSNSGGTRGACNRVTGWSQWERTCVLSMAAQGQKHLGNERSRQVSWITRQRATQTGKARAQGTGSISRPEVILRLMLEAWSCWTPLRGAHIFILWGRGRDSMPPSPTLWGRLLIFPHLQDEEKAQRNEIICQISQRHEACSQASVWL